VYIAGLIVAGLGFTAHASAATISQTIADTQTNDGFAQTQLIGTNLTGAPQSLTVQISHTGGGSIAWQLKILECTSAGYITSTASCVAWNGSGADFGGSGGHLGGGNGVFALQTGSSATSVTFTIAETSAFRADRFYVFQVENTTQANNALPATATCNASHQCYFYGTLNNVVGLDGCDNTTTYEGIAGLCGSVKNLYFVLTLSDTVLPHTNSISPTSGPVGTLVAISGSNFGSTQGSSTVSLGTTAATVSSWSDTQIIATVPSLSVGTYDVMITTSAGSSNLVSFQIISSGPSIAVSSSLDIIGFNQS